MTFLLGNMVRTKPTLRTYANLTGRIVSIKDGEFGLSFSKSMYPKAWFLERELEPAFKAVGISTTSQSPLGNDGTDSRGPCQGPSQGHQGASPGLLSRGFFDDPEPPTQKLSF